MAKIKIGELYNKPIVKGDKNLVENHEIYIDDLISESQGGSTTNKLKIDDVNFFDYDGTLLYSYTYEEACALTELPPAPSHEGLVFQEWNYTLEDIKEQGSNNIVGRADVAPNYITEDEATTIIINVSEDNLTNAVCVEIKGCYGDGQISVNEDIIDWGDGTVEMLSEHVPTAYIDTELYHQYSKAGTYTIKYWRNLTFQASIVHIDNAEPIKVVGYGKNALVSHVAPYVNANIPKGSAIEIDFDGNAFGYLAIPRDHRYCSIMGNNYGYCRGISYPVTIEDNPTFLGGCVDRVILPKSVTTLEGGYNGYTGRISTFIANSPELHIDTYFGNIEYFETHASYLNFHEANISTLKVSPLTTTIGSLSGAILIDCSDCTSIPVLETSLGVGIHVIVIPDELYDEWINATNWSGYTPRTAFVKSSIFHAQANK